MYTPQPCVRRAHRHHLTVQYPPIVGTIYPVLIYISNWHIFPNCWHSISKTNTYLWKCTFPICARRAHKHPPNEQDPNLLHTIFQGPNLPHNFFSRGLIFRGIICRSPICRGQICHTHIFEGPNLLGPNLPGPNLHRTMKYVTLLSNKLKRKVHISKNHFSC